MPSQTAQILIQIRGALRAAQETNKLSRSVDNLGDQLSEAGNKALVASAKVALFGTGIGAIAIALPAMVTGLAAATVAVIAFGSALGGLVAIAAGAAFGVTQRFQETVGQAGSAAAQLKAQALDLRSAFFSSTAGGADAVMGGLVPLLKGVQSLVTQLGPAFTTVGKAMGDAFASMGPEIAKLAPSLSAFLRSSVGAFQPLGEIAVKVIDIFARLATAAMPYVIDALNALSPLLDKVIGAIDGGAVQSAFSVLGRIFGTIKTFVTAIADVVGPVLGPAIDKVSASFSGLAGPAGTLFGSIIAGAVQLASGVLPLIADAIRGLAPLFQKLVDSGALVKIGNAIATGIRAAVGYVRQLLTALAPMKPFVTNVIFPFAKGIAIGLIGALRAAIPIVRLIATALGWVGQKMAPLRGFIQGVGTVLATVFAGGILKAVGAAAKVGGAVAGIIGWLGRLGGPISSVVNAFVGGFNSIRSGVGSAISWLRGRLGALVSFITGLPSKFLSIGSRMGRGLMDGIKGALGAVGDIAKTLGNALVDLLNNLIPNKIPIPAAPDIDLPDNPIPHFAAGGPVFGGTPGRDSVPAMLMPGEHVLTSREVQAAGGHGAIFGFRSALMGGPGPVTAFAAGGPVGDRPSLAGSISMPDVINHIHVMLHDREIATGVDRVRLREKARNS